jgi:hypothetical protein
MTIKLQSYGVPLYTGHRIHDEYWELLNYIGTHRNVNDSIIAPEDIFINDPGWRNSSRLILIQNALYEALAYPIYFERNNTYYPTLNTTNSIRTIELLPFNATCIIIPREFENLYSNSTISEKLILEFKTYNNSFSLYIIT